MVFAADLVEPRWMSAIPTTRLMMTLAPENSWKPSPMLGVTIRGALGRAIMEEACVRADRACHACVHVGDCLVPNWYDPGRIGSPLARPFVVEARAKGERVTPWDPMHVEVWFFTPVPDGELIVDAAIRMARDGLGEGRVPHHVVEAVAEGATESALIERNQPDEPWPAPGTLRAFAREWWMPATGADLVFRTPLRSTDRSRPPTPRQVLRAAEIRVETVAQTVGASIDRRWSGFDEVAGDWVDAEYVEWSRYSMRQEDRLNLSGWTGVLRLRGLEGLEDLLVAAEVLRLGKGTSTGMGRFELFPTL